MRNFRDFLQLRLCRITGFGDRGLECRAVARNLQCLNVNLASPLSSKSYASQCGTPRIELDFGSSARVPKEAQRLAAAGDLYPGTHRRRLRRLRQRRLGFGIFRSFALRPERARDAHGSDGLVQTSVAVTLSQEVS
jgi:hypothetical protein